VHHRTLRIIDANLNRICEGLRVLEDVARFVIDDGDSSRKLKSMRHDLRMVGGRLGIILEESRDAENDIGSNFDLTHQHKDYSSIIRANSKRVEEGLRVLEELSKLPDMSSLMSGEDIKKFRYSVYTLSKALVLSVPLSSNRNLLRGPYIILKNTGSALNDLLPFAQEAIKAGAGIIALRGGFTSAHTAKGIKVMRELQSLCETMHVLFVLHDQIDLALTVRPDGICIENSTVEPAIWRRALPENTLIGRRLNSSDKTLKSADAGLDFILIHGEFTNVKKIAKARPVPGRNSPERIVIMHELLAEDLDYLMHCGIKSFAIDINMSLRSEALGKIRTVRKRIEKSWHI